MADDQRVNLVLRKWCSLSCLLVLTIGIAVLVSVKWSDLMQMTKCYSIDMSKAHKPVAASRVFVPARARESFFAAATEFAIVNHFEFRISRLRPEEETFVADLTSEDVMISIWNPLDVLNYTIRMYAAPGKSPNRSLAIKLFSELRAKVSAVAGVEVMMHSDP